MIHKNLFFYKGSLMLTLGKDVLGLILRECDAVSVCRLRITCHRLNTLGGTETLWAFLLKRDYDITDPFDSYEAYIDENTTTVRHYKSWDYTIKQAVIDGFRTFRSLLRCDLNQINLRDLMVLVNFNDKPDILSDIAVKYCMHPTTSVDGIFTLHYAILNKQYKILKLLLKDEQNLNQINKAGYSVLDVYFYATRNYEYCSPPDHIILSILLVYGANLLTKEPTNQCPKCDKIIKELWTQ